MSLWAFPEKEAKWWEFWNSQKGKREFMKEKDAKSASCLAYIQAALGIYLFVTSIILWQQIISLWQIVCKGFKLGLEHYLIETINLATLTPLTYVRSTLNLLVTVGIAINIVSLVRNWNRPKTRKWLAKALFLFVTINFIDYYISPLSMLLILYSLKSYGNIQEGILDKVKHKDWENDKFNLVFLVVQALTLLSIVLTFVLARRQILLIYSQTFLEAREWFHICEKIHGAYGIGVLTVNAKSWLTVILSVILAIHSRKTGYSVQGSLWGLVGGIMLAEVLPLFIPFVPLVVLSLSLVMGLTRPVKTKELKEITNL